MNDRRLTRSQADIEAVGVQLVIAGMECSRLKLRAETLVRENEALQRYQTEAADLRDRVKVLESSLQAKSELGVEACKMAKSISALKAEVKEKNQMVARLESELQVLKLGECEADDKSAFNGSLMDQLEELRKENMTLSQENLSLKKKTEEIENLRRENSKLDCMLDDLKHRNTESKVKHDLSKDLNNRIVSLENDNAKLRVRLNELLDRENTHIHRQESIATLEDRLRSLLTSYEDCQSTLEETEKKNQELKKDASKLASYEQSINRLIEENARLSEVLTSMNQKLKADTTAVMSRDNTALRLEAESLRHELERTKRELDEKNEKIKSLNSGLSLKSAEASQLEVVLTENDRLAGALTQVGKDLAERSKEKRALEEKLRKVESEFKAASDGSHSSVIGLQGQIDRQAIEIQQLNIAKDSLAKENQILQQKCRDQVNLENDLRVCKSKLDSLNLVCEDLKIHNSSLNEQLSDMRRDLSAKNASLHSQRTVQDELQEANRAKESYEFKLKSLTSQLAQRDMEVDLLKEELHKVGQSTAELSVQSAEVSKYRTLYMDSQERAKRLEQLDTKVEILQHQNRGLHDTNADLRKALISQQTSAVEKNVKESISGEAFAKMKSMVQELEMEISLLRERESGLKSQVNQLSGKVRTLDALEGQLSIQIQANEQLRTAKEEIAADLKKVRGELIRERESSSQASVDAEDRRILRMDLTNKAQQIQDLETKLHQQETERFKLVSELKTKVQKLTAENEKMEEELALERAANSRNRRELDLLKDKADQFEKVSAKHDRQSSEFLEKDTLIAGLKRRLEQLEGDQSDTGRRLEVQLQMVKDESSKLTVDLDQAKRELKERQAKIEILEDEIKHLKRAEVEKRRVQEDNSRLEAACTSLKSQTSSFQELREANSNLVSKLHTSEEDCAALRKRVSDLVSLMDELRNLNIDLEMNNKGIPKLEARVHQLETILEAKQQEVSTLKDQNTSLLKATNDQILGEKNTESKLEATLAEAEKKLKHWESLASSLHLEVESLRLQSDRQKQELVMADNYLEELKRVAKESQGRLADNQHLQAEKQEAEASLRSKETEIGIYRDKLGEALTELEKMPRMEAELRQRKKEIADLEARNTQLVKESDALRLIMKEREAELVSLCTKSDMNRQSLTNISLEQMKNELAVMERDRAKWKKLADELEKSLSKQAREYERRVMELQSENKRLTNNVTGANEITQARTQESDHLLSELDASRKQADLLEFKLKESYAKINWLQEQNELALVSAEEMRGKLQTTELSLTRENRKLIDVIQRAETELVRLRSQVDRQSEDIRNKSADIAALRQKQAILNR